MPNTQPVSPIIHKPGVLLVHSVWVTIQGEGPLSGCPSVFVRLGGCNLRCPACDTEYTEGSREMTVAEVAELIAKVWTDFHVPYFAGDGHPFTRFPNVVVFTGGEPLRQSGLRDFFEHVAAVTQVYSHHWSETIWQIETNGTTANGIGQNKTECHATPEWYRSNVRVVCSPKTSRIHPDLIPYISALKYVLSWETIDPTDGLPTTALGRKAQPARWNDIWGPCPPIFIQPLDRGGNGSEFDKKRDREAVVNSALCYGYIAQLQIHKELGVD